MLETLDVDLGIIWEVGKPELGEDPLTQTKLKSRKAVFFKGTLTFQSETVMSIKNDV